MCVSVVIPAYNAEPFLEETVKSALKQEPDLLDRIWIVDDGSSDRTKRLGENLARTHEKVSFLSQENQGPSAARNLGLREVESEWIAFLDADDIWTPNFISTAIASLREAKAHAFIAQAERFEETPGDLATPYGPVKKYRDNMPESLLSGIPFAPCMGIVATRLAKQIGGFRGGDIYWEDWDFWIQIAEAKAKFVMHEGTPLVYYRRVSGSRSDDAIRCFNKSLRTLDLHWDSDLAPLAVKKKAKAQYLRWIGKSSPTWRQRISSYTQAISTDPFGLKNWALLALCLVGSGKKISAEN